MRRPKLPPVARKLLVGLGASAAVAYLALGAVLWHAMNQSPEYFGAVMRRMPQPAVFLLYPFETFWMRARAGSLGVGDPAPDFSLQTLDRTSTVQLSALTSRQPVVLVFGSYT